MHYQWIREDLLEVEYDSLSKLMETTYRFSHYHEYPEWRKKPFTKEELNEYYKETKGDPMWWKNQWAGANLRDTDLKPFLDGTMGDLDESEKGLLDLLAGKEEPYGVALYATQTRLVRSHEVAHSLFYLDEKYREKVSALIEEYRHELTDIEKELSEMYDDENLVDELHVYAGIFYDYWAKHKELKVPRKLRRELCRIFNKRVRKVYAKSA